MKSFWKYFLISIKIFGVIISLDFLISLLLPKSPPSKDDKTGINANTEKLQQNVTITNYIPESFNEWKKYNRLKTGEYPYVNVNPNLFNYSSLCELKIINDSRLDAVVFVIDNSNDTIVRHTYIRQGTKFTFFRVPEGKYFIKVYIGFDWNPEKYILGGMYKGGFNYSEALVSFRDTDDDIIEMHQKRDGNYLSGSRFDFRIFHKSIMEKIESKGTGL